MKIACKTDAKVVKADPDRQPLSGKPRMNTITLVVTVLTLWLVMGLGFLAKYVACKRDGKPGSGLGHL